MLDRIVPGILSWLGLNKLLLLVAAGGMLAAGGIFLWKDAQLSDARAALALQQRDIAVEAAAINAATIEENRRLSRANGEALARHHADQRAQQAGLLARLQEINNAPLPSVACPADPVLDRTLERVWPAEGNRGAGHQTGTGRDRPPAAGPAALPAAPRPSRPAPAQRHRARAAGQRLQRLRGADRPDPPAARSRAGAAQVKGSPP